MGITMERDRKVVSFFLLMIITIVSVGLFNSVEVEGGRDIPVTGKTDSKGADTIKDAYQRQGLFHFGGGFHGFDPGYKHGGFFPGFGHGGSFPLPGESGFSHGFSGFPGQGGSFGGGSDQGGEPGEGTGIGGGGFGNGQGVGGGSGNGFGGVQGIGVGGGGSGFGGGQGVGVGGGGSGFGSSQGGDEDIGVGGGSGQNGGEGVSVGGFGSGQGGGSCSCASSSGFGGRQSGGGFGGFQSAFRKIPVPYKTTATTQATGEDGKATEINLEKNP